MWSPRGTPIYNWRGCSSAFSKATPKSYHIGCGYSQFYSLKVISEIFIRRNSTGKLTIIAKRQQIPLCMNGYWHVTSRKRSKSYSFDSKCYFFLPNTLKATESTISTPKSYDEHPRQIKYGSLPPPPGIWSSFSFQLFYLTALSPTTRLALCPFPCVAHCLTFYTQLCPVPCLCSSISISPPFCLPSVQ